MSHPTAGAMTGIMLAGCAGALVFAVVEFAIR
jgi:hypothetical protein